MPGVLQKAEAGRVWLARRNQVFRSWVLERAEQNHWREAHRSGIRVWHQSHFEAVIDPGGRPNGGRVQRYTLDDILRV